MKKLFTLALAAMASLAASAQSSSSRVWDFRQGFSDETLSNLSVDAASDDGLWTQYDTYFQSKARSEGQITCMVGGESWTVPEAEGLTFHATSAQHLNIVFSHSDAPHIWINGSRDQDAVTIPSVEAGDSITVIYASHSSTEARGFKVSTSGVVGKYDGLTQWTTVGKLDTVVMVNNNTETVDVKLTATSGYHLFYICVGERPADEDSTPSIAYFYDSSSADYSLDDDIPYVVLTSYTSSVVNVDVTPIDIAGDVSLITADSLQGYDLVAISASVKGDNSFVQTLREAVSFTPMLNFGPEIYEAWGLGSAVQTETNALVVGKAAISSQLFQPIDPTAEQYVDEDGNLILYADGYSIVGYETLADSYFSKDSVYATADGVPAIHVHNISRNAYMLLPYTLNIEPQENANDIITNAVSMLCATKATVTRTFSPVVSQEYHHGYTTVSFSSSTANSTFYYTLDGSEPTEESTLYTEPFDVSETGVTVKVVAIADGYLLSNVTEQTIDIYELADAPTISYTEEEGSTTITITPAQDDDVVYYNLTGSSETARSDVYSEPITITKHATITAFTGARDNYLQSETVSVDVPVQGENVRLDVIAHMDANRTDWCPDGSSNYYYVGRSGYNYYTDEIIGQNEDGSNIYEAANDLRYYAPGNGWEIKTLGQPVIWQSLTVQHNVGDVSNYNPATALDDADEEISNNCIQFASVSTSNGDGIEDPASASIQSTEAFQGPFDVVAYLGGPNNAAAGLYVSTDTLSEDNWVKIGEMTTPALDSSGRNWRKNLLSYEGTDMVYVKLSAIDASTIRVFDIYIKNEGEESNNYITGISDVTAGNEAAAEVVSTAIYSVNGARLASMSKGINIVKEVYANGQVKTRKVFVK